MHVCVCVCKNEKLAVQCDINCSRVWQEKCSNDCVMRAAKVIIYVHFLFPAFFNTVLCLHCEIHAQLCR